MVACCQELLDVHASEAAQVCEARFGLEVAQTQLSVLVEATAVDVADCCLHQRVMCASRDGLDACPIEVFHQSGPLQVVSRPLTQLALTVEAEAVEGPVGTQD